MSWRSLGILLAAALALRLTSFAIIQPWTLGVPEPLELHPDSRGFHELATTLLSDGEFARISGGSPEARITPVYPAFIAAVYAVFGPNPRVAILIQLLLDVGTCLLLTIAVGRMIGHRAGLCAGWLYAMDPHVLLYSSLLLTDSLFVFILAAALWIAARIASSTFDLKWMLALGGLLGVAALARPDALYFPVIVTVWIVWSQRGKWLRGALAVVALAVSFFVVIVPWVSRNHDAFGKYGFSTACSYGLLSQTVGPIQSYKLGIDAQTTTQRLLNEADSLLRADGLNSAITNEFTKAEYWRRVALRYIRDDPVAVAGEFLKGVTFTYLNLGASDIAKTLRLRLDRPHEAQLNDSGLSAMLSDAGRGEIFTAVLVSLFLMFTYFLTVRGMLIMSNGNVFLMYCLLGFVYFTLIAGAGGAARFRLPVLPFYLPFAGVGFQWLAELFRKVVANK